MISHLSKAFGQLSDPGSRRVFWRALALTVACYVLLWVAAFYTLAWAGDGLLAWAERRELSDFWMRAIEWLFAGGAVGAVVLVSFVLFPAAVAVALSLMLEEVCRRVEVRHYPDLPPARGQPISESLLDALRLAGATIGLNLLLLPIYMLLLFLPPLNVVVFYLVNGYLLGREYFEMAAVRRMTAADGRALRKANRGRVVLAGVVIAILLTIPLLNLFMPIVAMAFILHVFEDLRRRRSAGAGAFG